MAPQSTHDVDPASALCFPATHDVHVPPSDPEKPALQVQAVAMRLPTGELEFDGQVSHVAAPELGLKVPAPHDVHVPPSGPEKPALQVQSLERMLPTGELEFDGQVLHVCAPVAPTVPENVPPTQVSQIAEPGELLYVPAVQLVHAPPSGPLDPLSHVQSLRASLPAVHNPGTHVDDRAGQPKHMLDVAAPEVLEYLQITQ